MTLKAWPVKPACAKDALAFMGYDDALSGVEMPKTRLYAAYRQILVRDPCAYCGATDARLAWDDDGGRSCGEAYWSYLLIGMHRDHIEPRSGAGSDVWDNLTAACRSCNSSKGTNRLLLWMVER